MVETSQMSTAEAEAVAGPTKRTRSRAAAASQQENVDPTGASQLASTSSQTDVLQPTPSKPKKSKSSRSKADAPGPTPVPTPVTPVPTSQGDAGSIGDTVTLPAGDGSPANAGLASSEKGDRQKDLKAKVTQCVAQAMMSGDPMEMLARSSGEDVESCFPSITQADGLRSGSSVTPGQEALHELLAKTPGSGEQPTGPLSEEKLQTTALTGAFIGSPEIVEACLKQGVDLTVPDHSGRNVLHFLATTGNASLLKKVLRRLEKGTTKHASDPQHSFAEVINFADSRGWTPLIVAICRDNEEAAETLLAYPQLKTDIRLAHTCPPSQGPQPTESTAIHFAAIRGRASLAKTLIERGTPLSSLDSMGRNVFHYAAAHQDDGVATAFVAALIEHPKFDPALFSQRDIHERTPVFVAVAWGNLNCAKLILQVLKRFAGSQATSGSDAAEKQTPTAAPEAENPSSERETPETYSLSSLLFGPDAWALTAVQAAHLRRHNHVLFGLAAAWPSLRSQADPVTFVQAIQACNEEVNAAEPIGSNRPEDADLGEPDNHFEGETCTTVPQKLCSQQCSSPTRMLQAALQDKLLFSRWLKQDFDPLENAAFEAIKAALLDSLAGSETALLQEPQLMRAIRRVGVQMCLRCFAKTIEVVRCGNAASSNTGSAAGTARRRSPEAIFFAVLKNTIRTDLSEAEASAALNYINIEQNLGRKSAGRQPGPTVRQGSQGSVTMGTAPGVRTMQGPSQFSRVKPSSRFYSAPKNAAMARVPGVAIRSSSVSGSGAFRSNNAPLGGTRAPTKAGPPPAGPTQPPLQMSPRGPGGLAVPRGSKMSDIQCSPGATGTKRSFVHGPSALGSGYSASGTVPSFAQATCSARAKFGGNPRSQSTAAAGIVGASIRAGGVANTRMGSQGQSSGYHRHQAAQPERQRTSTSCEEGSFDESLDAVA